MIVLMMSFKTLFCFVVALILSSTPLFAQTVAQFHADAGKAIALVEAGKFDEAKSITKRLLEVEAGVAYPYVTMTMHSLAELYQAQGRYSEAELLYKRAQEINEKILVKDKDNETAQSLKHQSLRYLEELYHTLGRYSEAEQLCMRMMKIVEDKFGANHPNMMTPMNNLALNYARQGRYPDAESFYKQALAVLPEGHPQILTIWHNLTELYVTQGRYSEAESLSKQLLAALPEEHPETATVWNGLAELYRTLGCYSEAETLLKKALAILPEGHPLIPTSLCNLATVYAEQGRYFEAESLYKQTLAILPDSHHLIPTSLGNLALLYVDQGRYSEAEPLYKQALEILSEEHPDIVAVFLNNLAELYQIQGRYFEAETYYTKSLEIKRSIFPESHPSIVTSQSNLAALYMKQDRYTKAEPFLKRSLEISEEVFGERHPRTVFALNNLAVFYAKQGRHDEAEPLYDRAIETYEITTMLMRADFGSELYKDRSSLYCATDRPKLAVSDLKRAMILSLDARKNYSGTGEQQAKIFEEQHYYLFVKMVFWQYEFAQMGYENYDIKEAYEAMELSRACGLHELVAQYIQPKDLFKGVPEAKTEKLLKGEQDARIKMKELEQQLTNLPTRTDIDDSQMKNERRRLDGLLAEAGLLLRNADNAIKNESPFYQKFLSRPVPFVDVQKQLETDKCLAMQYLIGNEISFLLVYGFRQEPALFPLIIDEKQAALFGVEPGTLTADKLNKVFQNEQNTGVLQLVVAPFNIQRGDYPQLSRSEFSAFFEKRKAELTLQLHEKLVALWPILVPDEALRAKISSDDKSLNRLLILPDGTLTKFPFEMLVINNNPGNPQYLLDKGPATLYSPSARMYYNLTTLHEKPDMKSVLTVGDPVYEKVDEKPYGSGRCRSTIQYGALLCQWEGRSCQRHKRGNEMVSQGCRARRCQCTIQSGAPLLQC